MYNFGLYHWRRRFRAILSALVAIVLAEGCRRKSNSRVVRLITTATLLCGTVRVATTARRLFSPPPWAIDRKPYVTLASAVPFERAESALDIGCGTGRSLVGFAPLIPESCTVLGLDVFDDRVILGNGPALARRNGRAAGLDVTPLVGDAARLPITTDSQDVITACRVLHDLPATAVAPALCEAHRVCAPDGTFGLFELPIVPDDTTVPPEEYWPERVSQAGFTITSVEQVSRERGEPSVLVVATP